MAAPAKSWDSRRTVNVGAFFENIKKQCAYNGGHQGTSGPRSISDLFAKYDETVRSTKSGDQQLQETRDELVARIRGQDAHGRPLNRPDMPSEADLEAMEAREAELFRPFAEDTVEVMTAVGLKRFTVAQVMQALQQKTETNGAELERINAEIEQISAEIDVIADELEHGTDSDVKRAKAELDAELERIEKAEEDTGRQYQAGLAELKKQEQESKAAWEHKLEQLMEEIV